MAKLLPFRRSDTPQQPREPRLVELDDETADDVFAALSAGTARDILRQLYQEPGTATDVAEAADTSLQNARYHLEKLQTAGLVEDVDTWYSSRGTEMTVYAPTNEPLVVAAGPDEQTSVLRSALGRLVGALGVLGIASLVIDRVARARFGVFESNRAAGGDGGDAEMLAKEATTTVTEADVAVASGNATTATPSPTPFAESTRTVVEEGTPTPTEAAATPTPQATATPTPSPAPEPTQMATQTPEPTTVAAMDSGAIEFAGGLPPGAMFFLGGLIVLGAVAIWWYFRSYRPLYG